MLKLLCKNCINFSFCFSWNSLSRRSINKKINVNFRPQHPAAHGVLRLIV